ncbi:PspC domain-containing protein [Nonomuraea sp. PA05]|uniref:PspC domain-containing protein n=1 Tax=Nonomuraea sp. PA05 TaxID=2604466 RepID=UPI0016529FDB|nr:PspC domain-containing protein [Nonomuraea sp. PA05]
MTEAPPRQPASPPRELRRSSEGRFLMGVCAGLGRHTGIDPVVFRVGFAVLLLGSGIGLFLYISAFLLMKEPNGRPGIIEQWTRRDFDAEAVMALLTAVLGFGLAINLATVWLDTGTLVVGVFLAVSLLAAHASGVDLRALARSMPERLSRRPGAERPAASYESAAPPAPVRAPTPPQAPAPPVPPQAPAAPTPPPAEDLPEKDAAAARQEVAEGVPEAAPTATPEAARLATNEAAARQAEGVPEAARAAAPEEVSEAAAQARETARPMDDSPASPYAITAEHPTAAAAPPYRPTTAYGSHGEPFAPNGPYRPLDPAKRPGGYSPYDPSLYARPVQKRRRPRSFIGLITILLALITGGIVVAVQSRSAAGVSPTIVGGAMLITIGAGLLVAAWWGRGAGLVAAGTTVTLIVGMGLMLGGMPRNIGSAEWTPTTIAEASRLFDVGVGDGQLDLSELQLPPGSNVTVNAAVSAGELVVIVPPTARVEVHASNKVGDIVIDQSLRGGVDVRTNKVLEPEVKPKGKAPTIVLNLRGGLGDMEVRRAA